jgi:hypothetical protein
MTDSKLLQTLIAVSVLYVRGYCNRLQELLLHDPKSVLLWVILLPNIVRQMLQSKFQTFL